MDAFVFAGRSRAAESAAVVQRDGGSAAPVIQMFFISLPQSETQKNVSSTLTRAPRKCNTPAE